jgi:hypothetical protein
MSKISQEHAEVLHEAADSAGVNAEKRAELELHKRLTAVKKPLTVVYGLG